tara:strand:+ start:597 stop:1640 length:1044 start_codon:yes stop_codon:yes gene_type:complete
MTKKEILDQYNAEAFLAANKIILEGIPVVSPESDVVEALTRTLVASFLEEGIYEPAAFTEDLLSKDKRREHPHGLITLIYDLAAERTDMQEKHGPAWTNFSRKIATTKVKSVGQGEMFHPFLWSNPITSCSSDKGDVEILDGRAKGCHDDKGNNGEVPSMKGAGGKIRNQNAIFEEEYGKDWKDKYQRKNIAKETPNVERDFLPYVLEGDIEKFDRILRKLHRMPDDSYSLQEEDIAALKKYWAENPIPQGPLKKQKKIAEKRETAMCLVLARRSSLVYGQAGIRFNKTGKKDNRVSCLFIQAGVLAIEKLSEAVDEVLKKKVTLKLVKANKNSNYAYNDGRWKAKF